MDESFRQDVQFSQAKGVPIADRVLHMQGEIQQLQVHRQQEVRGRLRRVLSARRTAHRRDMQRLRPTRQTLEETTGWQQSKLETRESIY